MFPVLRLEEEEEEEERTNLAAPAILHPTFNCFPKQEKSQFFSQFFSIFPFLTHSIVSKQNAKVLTFFVFVFVSLKTTLPKGAEVMPPTVNVMEQNKKSEKQLPSHKEFITQTIEKHFGKTSDRRREHKLRVYKKLMRP